MVDLIKEVSEKSIQVIHASVQVAMVHLQHIFYMFSTYVLVSCGPRIDMLRRQDVIIVR